MRTDVPSYRVRNDVPGPGRVYSKLPETRVRPGGLPATRYVITANPIAIWVINISEEGFFAKNIKFI